MANFGIQISHTGNDNHLNAIDENTLMSKPGIAAVLSFLIPGVGQIYNGYFIRALFWLIITPGFWVGSGGTLGWLCHLISSYTAYQKAKEDLVFNLPDSFFND
jgi:TM2 domain-containing membrane protein YozV